MRARLIVTKGKDTGKSFYVKEGKPITLGRSSAADVSLSEPKISRIHCRLTHDGKHIMLTDLNSTNGTYVNERKIKSVPLAENDTIRIGETVMTIRFEEDAPAAEPESAVKIAPKKAERPSRPALAEDRGSSPPLHKGEKAAEAPKGGESDVSVMGLFDKWLEEPQKRAVERPSAPARRESIRPERTQRPGAPEIGLRIPGVELRKKVGEDALGEIHEGVQVFLDRPVSVQILSDADESQGAAFEEWARAYARLNHPNIIQLYDSGKAGDLYYAVWEIPEGLTLDGLMVREGQREPLPVSLALEIALQLARALRRAHAEKVVHWNLRPSAIFVSRERVAKIGGFKSPRTIARSALGGGEMTSRLPVHPYLAPELIHDIDVADASADIYGLCAVLYDMVCGRPPFQSDSERSLMEMILRQRPETPQKHNPALPPELCLLILKGLAKVPTNRFASASDLVKELKEVARGKTALGQE